MDVTPFCFRIEPYRLKSYRVVRATPKVESIELKFSDRHNLHRALKLPRPDPNFL